MRRIALLTALALGLSACASASVSQSLLVRPLFNDTTVGWHDYPIVIEGAERVGLTPEVVAANMRFPARLPAGSTFRAISGPQVPVTHAHLAIPSDGASNATLTFVHGARRTGVGTFAIPASGYANPAVLGSVSAALISDMLKESRRRTRDSNRLDFF